MVSPYLDQHSMYEYTGLADPGPTEPSCSITPPCKPVELTLQFLLIPPSQTHSALSFEFVEFIANLVLSEERLHNELRFCREYIAANRKILDASESSDYNVQRHHDAQTHEMSTATTNKYGGSSEAKEQVRGWNVPPLAPSPPLAPLLLPPQYQQSGSSCNTEYINHCISPPAHRPVHPEQWSGYTELGPQLDFMDFMSMSMQQEPEVQQALAGDGY